MEVMHVFTANLATPGNAPVLHAVQYDDVRQISVQLYSGTAVWTVPDGVVAGIGYTLPNRKSGYYEELSDGTTACTIDGNTVQAVLAPVLTSMAGLVQVSIVLRQGEEQLSTFPFRLRVATRPGVVEPDAQPDAASIFAGKLYYGGKNGVAVPLAIGDGLAVEEDTLSVPDAVGKTYVDQVVAELWAEIRYVPIEISNFRHNAGTVELGTVLESVKLSWAVNKAPTGLSINGEAVAADTRSVALGPVSETTKFTVSATDERGAADDASTTVYFYNGVYYGALEAGTEIDSAIILSLTRKLQGSRGISFTIDPGGARPTYACPTRYGTPKFVIGGFEYGWNKIAVIDFTNASGYTESYDIWQHGQDVSGSITVTVS